MQQEMTVPTTLTSLILFILLVIPGITYGAIRNHNQPTVGRTTFQEISEIAAASLGLSTLTLLLSWGVASAFPEISLNTGELIENPQHYLSQHHIRFGLWLIILVISATCFAWPLARYVRYKFPYSAARMSSWYVLFRLDRKENQAVWVEAELDDGSWVQGRLRSSNNNTEDISDRDLILVRPLYVRKPGSDIAEPSNNHAICISARHIRTLHTYYYEPQDDPDSKSNSELSFLFRGQRWASSRVLSAWTAQILPPFITWARRLTDAFVAAFVVPIPGLT